jgi:hypothetical protein
LRFDYNLSMQGNWQVAQKVPGHLGAGAVNNTVELPRRRATIRPNGTRTCTIDGIRRSRYLQLADIQVCLRNRPVEVRLRLDKARSNVDRGRDCLCPSAPDWDTALAVQYAIRAA